MQEIPLVYRSYQDGDEKAINRLYKEVFGKERSEEQWRWEFQNPPEGPANIRVIEHKGRIVAHIALIPIRFQFFDKEILVGKSEDSSILKDYRGKRLFGPLERECLNTAAEKGFSLAYSISRTARKVHMKVGYKPLEPMKGCFVPIHAKKMANAVSPVLPIRGAKKIAIEPALALLETRFKRRCKKNRSEFKNICVKKIDRFDHTADELWKDFANQNHTITVKRSSKYLNWRFADNPNKGHHILLAFDGDKPIGYLVASTVNRKEEFHYDLWIGIISDFLVLKGYEDALYPLFNHALDYWQSKGCVCLMNWGQVENPLFQEMGNRLKRLGFVPMLRKFNIPISVRVFDDNISHEKILYQKNWFMTLALCGRWA